MSAPVVPQRPTRTHQQPSPSDTSISPTAAADATPKIPPRPQREHHLPNAVAAAHALQEQDGYTRSPLNDSPFAASVPPKNGEFYKQPSSKNASVSSLPPRPPSVPSLPMIGQEGMEYSAFDKPYSLSSAAAADADAAATPASPKSGNHPTSPTETRNVAGDLPLHAPRASIPAQKVADQVTQVTRTISRTAGTTAGSVADADDHANHPQSHAPRPPSSRSGYQRPPSTGYTRPPSTGLHRPPSASHRPSSSRAESLHGEDDVHGIPEIGLQVPMYPNAGDVQAPSPAQHSGYHAPASGDGVKTSHDGRRRSAQGFHVPPGSYGLHGHGMIHNDQFEKSWYQKHPEELVKEEHGAYGPAAIGNRSEWALSSEQLNNLVRATSHQDNTYDPTKAGIPSEFIGHAAAEAYTSKMASAPHSPSLTPVTSRLESHQVEQPIRKTPSVTGQQGNRSITTSEAGDEPIHIDDEPHYNRHYWSCSGQGVRTGEHSPRVDSFDENGQEHESRTPILASDERAKDPNGEWLHPAVSSDHYFGSDDTYYANILDKHHSHDGRRSSGQYRSGSRSRPNSRPSSIHNLSRYNAHEDNPHTSLEEIEEYEPLFKDDDDEKPQGLAQKLKKRPDLEKHRFPSQDIWEDTPTSLQLETTVDTEQEPAEEKVGAAANTSRSTKYGHFESPEVEAARRGEISESQRIAALKQQKPGNRYGAAVDSEMRARPGLQQRFPSQDIWEDTPDSLSLTTTIDSGSPEERGLKSGAVSSLGTIVGSPPDSKPLVPARPSVRPRPVPQTVDLAPPTAQAKDASPPEKKQAPLVPGRPKPQIPPRPGRAALAEVDDSASLSKTISAGSAGSTESNATTIAGPSSSKPKPPVPSRPAATNSKFAQMRAGFMNDLNSKLQLGPQAPPKQQPVAATDNGEGRDTAADDIVPLADARKGRARGPARRKPAAASDAEAASTAAAAPAKQKFSFSKPQSVWQVGHTDSHALHVYDYSSEQLVPKESLSKPVGATTVVQGEQPTASPLAINTAGEALLTSAEAPQIKSGALAHGSDVTMDSRAVHEEAEQEIEVAEHITEQIGYTGDVPEPKSDHIDGGVPLARKTTSSSLKSETTFPLQSISTDERPELEGLKSEEAAKEAATIAPLQKRTSSLEVDEHEARADVNDA